MTFALGITRLSLAIAAGLVGLSGVDAQSPPATPEAARTAWGFARSDLTPHPAVRFGVLANGMRYALMRNTAPAGSLSARFHVDAGATAEGDREQGQMHLLEHLIFHGTPNVPEGTLPTMLAQRGLRRWSDFSAFTSFDETAYRLDLARADRASRDTALMLMREIAGNLSFSHRAVEGAKRRVQEEIRARDPVQDRITTAQNAFFMPGTPIARGPVAGTQASVERASGVALRRLYERYYIPARSTLVLVGDFDPDAVEAEIVARFSDWQARGAAVSERTPSAMRSDHGIETRLFVDPAAATGIVIAAVESLGAADAGARRDAHFLEHLGNEMLSRRLARIGAQAEAPFASANAAVYDLFSTARLARVEVAAKGRDWRTALQRGALELRRAVAQGFAQSELDEQLAASRRAFAGNRVPQTSSALADAIVDSVGRKIMFTAPGGLAANDAYLGQVRLAEVNAAFRSAWASPGRLIFVSHNRPIPKAAIAAAWTASLSAAAPVLDAH